MRYLFFTLALFFLQKSSCLATSEQHIRHPQFQSHHSSLTKTSIQRIGIIFALPDNSLLQTPLPEQFPWLANIKQTQEGSRSYFHGVYLGKQIIISSLWPTKVGAAITTSNMILQQKVDMVLVIGSCYSRDPRNHLFDLLLPKGYIHHDTDLRPMLNKFETPENQLSIFQTSPELFQAISRGSRRFLNLERRNIENLLKKYGFIQQYTEGLHSVKEGVIATGEPFSLSRKYFLSLQRDLPEIAGFDNSGCAIAQVCHEYGIPCMGLNIVEPHPMEAPNQESWGKLLREIRKMYTKELVELLLEEIVL
ncbi:5'-methylthioadenosine nucleosidase [Chlamydiifrater phoenicopteri]|uniref:5'-methylthioadenosine/S-adenosylhomocysteine nucleosidase family protein n=1 Tax=Chlamydiifrater phoenicopteri TaxID=2681469 RepID=UPI001BD0C655|nr:5'-methylthioadenosine nucleosidase [Chlamydiifrater phoenicopteri]